MRWSLTTEALSLCRCCSRCYLPFAKAFSHILSSRSSPSCYGFLRIGECTSHSKHFDPSQDISFKYLHFHPEHYSIQLKHSKGKGARSIIIARMSGQFCPFKSMASYSRSRSKMGPYSPPLFLIPDGAPMSTSWFTKHFKSILRLCDLSPSFYTGHSFRISTAISAASTGISTSTLQQLRHWSSSAYSLYMRPDSASILAAKHAFRCHRVASQHITGGGNSACF